MATLGNRPERGPDETNDLEREPLQDEVRDRAHEEQEAEEEDQEQERREEHGHRHEEEEEGPGGEEEADRRGRGQEQQQQEEAGGMPVARPEELFGVRNSQELYQVVSKYAKVKQPVPFSSQHPKWRINLDWRDINYKVVVPLPPKSLLGRLLLKLPIPAMLTNRFKQKKEIPILNNVSGSAHAGQVIAIMGPTGSGKTTLLNVLAQRITKNVTGDLRVNGEEVKGRRFKRRMAYVLQDDIFFPMITVRNTVRDAAYLKLPKSMSFKQKREKVEYILTELGLQRCANTIVGGDWVRGVSGGERKRTNIATELVSNPALIFLDEPTTGLDAATSLGLIVSLKTLAKSGHTVVTTIHQPSSAMFQMFDKVLLMAEGGWVVYSGSARDIMSYFDSLGLHAPPTYNPADFGLEVVSSRQKIKDGRTVRQLLIDTYAENEKKQQAEPRDQDQAEEQADQGQDQSQGHGIMAGSPGGVAELEKASIEDMQHGKKFPTPFYLQTWVLGRRAFTQRKGDILGWDRIIQVITIAVLAGLLWLRRSTTEDHINDISGFLFFSTMFWIMNTWFNSLFAFPPELGVMFKERATGSYRLSAYFIGKVLAETPLELILPIIFGCITYWMVNLSPKVGCFFFYLAILCLFALMGSGIGLFISATIPDVKKALTLSVVIFLSSVLLGGFFIAQENLRVWIRWSRWMSFMKYSYELLLINEFDLGSRGFTPNTPSAYGNINPITGGAILDRFNVETNIWGDLMFLAGMIIITRVLAYLSLLLLIKPRG